VVKQVANKSKTKVSIITSIDKKISLVEIARQNDLNMDDLMDELDVIVSSGTKLNIDYYIEDLIDESVQDEIYDYFRQADTDDQKTAWLELKDDDITMEEIQLMRIKFLSEMAN
jgi:ATP-dependent DNA helicase RecQ